MSDAVKLASGYIELTVKAAGKGMQEIITEVTGIEKAAKKSSDAAGRAIESGVAKGAKEAGRKAREEITEAAAKAGTEAGEAIDKGITDAAEKAGKTAGEAIDKGVSGGATRAGKSAGDAIERGTKAGAERAGRSAGSAIERGTRAGAERAGKSAGDAIDKGARSTRGSSKSGGGWGDWFNDVIVDGARRGAEDAGANLDQEIIGAAGRAGSKVGGVIHDAIADSPMGPILSNVRGGIDGIVDVAGRGADAIQGINDATVALGGNGFTLDSVANAAQSLQGLNLGGLRDMRGKLKGMPGKLKGLKPGDAANLIGKLDGKDIGGALAGGANTLNALGLNDAGGAVGDIAAQATELQNSFYGARENIQGAASGLLAITGNSGRIAGGLGAISRAAGPLAVAFEVLKRLPGWQQGFDGMMAQIQGQKDFDLSDWTHGGVPIMGTVDNLLGISRDRKLTGGGLLGALGAKAPPAPTTTPMTQASKDRASSMLLPPGFARGGIAGVSPLGEIFGPGSGTSDSILGVGADGVPTALVSRGEGVVRKSAMDGGAGPLVAALNGGLNVDALRGILPGFDSGNPAPDPMMLRWLAAIQSGRIGPDGSLPMGVGNEGGLQVNTIRGKRLLSALFPEVTDIGGYRQDSLKWHPSGLALDVMTPGGSTRGGRNPAGKLIGDQISAFMAAHAAELGSDYTLWQTDSGGDHYNHDHVNFSASGMPGKDQKYMLPPSMMAMLGLAQQQGADASLVPGVAAAANSLQMPGRTEGYIPAGAGGSGQAGSSLFSGFLNMGAEAINGLIDQAASAAATGANVMMPGSGGAAGAAIGIGTQMAKRGIQYGFQMAGIGIDSLAEIFMPFGVPRLFNTDPTQFMPQLPGMPTAVTTGEKAELQQTDPSPDPGLQPAGPVQPRQLPGQSPVGAPAAPAQPSGVPAVAPPVPAAAPPVRNMTDYLTTLGTTTSGSAAPAPAAPAPQLAPAPQRPNLGNQILGGLGLPQFAKGGLVPGLYDKGGWLPPGGLAINKTKTLEPMPVFTPEQWGTLGTLANRDVAAPDPSTYGANTYNYGPRIENVTVKDVEEFERNMSASARVESMRHRGRP